MPSTTEQTRAWRDKQIEAGLCAMCVNPAEPNRQMCQKHLDIQSNRVRRNRTMRKSAGSCPNCGKSPENGNTYCTPCIRRVNEYTWKGNGKANYDGNRRKARERDNDTCRICGGNNALTVHHIDGHGLGNPPCNHALENLITLCKPCHSSITYFIKVSQSIDTVVALIQEQEPVPIKGSGSR